MLTDVDTHIQLFRVNHKSETWSGCYTPDSIGSRMLQGLWSAYVKAALLAVLAEAREAVLLELWLWGTKLGLES